MGTKFAWFPFLMTFFSPIYISSFLNSSNYLSLNRLIPARRTILFVSLVFCVRGHRACGSEHAW